MDCLNLYAISAASTVMMILLYACLYIMFQKRYMAAWIAAWSCHFLRYIIFDLNAPTWINSQMSFISYQIMFIFCVHLFIYSAHLFTEKPLNRLWVYSSIAVLILSISCTASDLPLVYKLSPPFFYSSVVLLYIGKTFLTSYQFKKIGRYVTGWAFIFWGLLTAIMPFLIDSMAVWSKLSLACGILRLIIVTGTLLLYLESSMSDLIKKESHYRMLTENAVDIIYRLKFLPEYRYEYIGPAILELTGYSPKEFYRDAELLRSLIITEDLALYDDFLTTLKNGKLTNSPKDCLLPTIRLAKGNQEIIWIEQKCTVLYDENKNVVGLEGIIRDVTIRKNLEQIAAKVDKMDMVGKMAVSVAHEIRNPLTTVLGYLQMMRRKEQNTERFDLMIKELTKTNTIISEYLLLAQDKRAVLKQGNLNNYIRTLLSLMETDAIAFNSSIKLNLGEIPEIAFDETEIRQLLFHLIRNGLEAMPSGGNITVCTSYENNTVILRVQDEGGGMPNHVVENLGTPFLTTKTSGTGLGLPMCYRIIDRHNGTIKIETSEKGTSFNIYFKVAKTHESTAAPKNQKEGADLNDKGQYCDRCG